MSTLKNLWQRRREESGFTLMELLVVILIIGVLVAIVAPDLLGLRKNAYDATTESDTRNAATLAHSGFTEKINALDPSTMIMGYAPGSPTGKSRMSVVFDSGQGIEVLTDEFIVSEGTRGSLGGTAARFTICNWNPFGKRYRNPQTARVWDSSDGTFRRARHDDDCVAVAEQFGEGSDPGDDPGDEPGDGGSLPPIQAVFQPITPGDGTTRVRMPMEIFDPEGERVWEVPSVGIAYDGYLICPDVPILEGWGVLNLRNIHLVPGGVIQVVYNEAVIGAYDFSSYEFIGHAFIDPALLSLTGSITDDILVWADANLSGAQQLSVTFDNGYATTVYHGGESVSPEGLPPGTGSYTSFDIDREAGMATVYHYVQETGETLVIAHRIGEVSEVHRPECFNPGGWM